LDELCVLVNQQQLAEARRVAEEEGHLGNNMMARMIYNERYNLRATALRLVRHVHAGGGVVDSTPDIAWSNYIRFLLEANRFYQFSSLRHDRFVYIARNRTAPGRQQLGEGDAAGRLITHAWFEVANDEYHDGGILVQPVTLGQSRALDLRNATMAEIMLAAGLHLEAGATARDTELIYERAFADLEVLRFVGERYDARRSEWYFVLQDPTEVEEYTYMSRNVNDLTKMALARRLQVIEGSDDATRSRRWELTKDALLQLLVDNADLAVGAVEGLGDDEDDDSDAPPAPPRGRGRGRGRGLPKGAAKAKAKAEARGRGRAGGEGGRGRVGGRGGRGRGRGGRG
jgi:hypothetical protein